MSLDPRIAGSHDDFLMQGLAPPSQQGDAMGDVVSLSDNENKGNVYQNSTISSATDDVHITQSYEQLKNQNSEISILDYLKNFDPSDPKMVSLNKQFNDQLSHLYNEMIKQDHAQQAASLEEQRDKSKRIEAKGEKAQVEAKEKKELSMMSSSEPERSKSDEPVLSSNTSQPALSGNTAQPELSNEESPLLNQFRGIAGITSSAIDKTNTNEEPSTSPSRARINTAKGPSTPPLIGNSYLEASFAVALTRAIMHYTVVAMNSKAIGATLFRNFSLALSQFTKDAVNQIEIRAKQDIKLTEAKIAAAITSIVFSVGSLVLGVGGALKGPQAGMAWTAGAQAANTMGSAIGTIITESKNLSVIKEKAKADQRTQWIEMCKQVYEQVLNQIIHDTDAKSQAIQNVIDDYNRAMEKQREAWKR